MKLALLACILIAACGGASKGAIVPPPSTAAPEANPGAGSPLGEAPMQQIEDLERQIDAQSGQLQLGEIRMPEVAPAPHAMATSSASDPMCKPAKTDTCKTSCTLSDSICKNADSICRIAQNDLPGDSKAAGKCARANTTCDASHKKCCGCQ